jgi:hypothetical protein
MTDQPASAFALPLRTGVHAAYCPDGIVFLDIPGDTYFSLYAPRGQGVPNIAPLLDAMSESGLLAEPGTTTHPSSPHPEYGWRELPEHSAERPPMYIATAFALAFTHALMRWNMRSFAGLLAWASRPPAVRKVPARHDFAQLISWFEWLLLWLPARPLCLFRSLLLLHFLRRHGLNARWVFGVSLFPFHAHCWLAVGDLLLGERADRADEFTPIFSTPISAR